VTKDQRLDYRAAKMRLGNYRDGKGARCDPQRDRDLIARFDQDLLREEIIQDWHRLHLKRGAEYLRETGRTEHTKPCPATDSLKPAE
jgi:hypothetical protein